MEIFSEICWINKQWKQRNELCVPIQDRGLTLGDGIFETILISDGKPQLLSEHIHRWHHSALLLGMATPPTQKWLEPLISEGIQRLSIKGENSVLRLNWSRGDNNQRGIEISPTDPQSSDHRFWLEITHGTSSFHPISTTISRHEKRNANSRLSHCKTFGYGQAIQARREANLAGCDDALLLSTTGEICCGTTANLIIQRKGQWLTPRLASGCLPGVMRQQGINAGVIQEATLNPNPEDGDQWLLINSLGCRAIRKLNNTQLTIFEHYKELWLSLLGFKKP